MTDAQADATTAATALKQRIQRLDDDALDLIFREARTYTAWLDKPVTDDDLRALHDLMRWGPTSGNCCPIRLVFVQSPEAKERLKPCLAPGNVDKTMAAPATAIVAYDLKFWVHLPRLFPVMDMQGMYRDSEAMALDAAFRNGSLQGAYMIVAARSLGLDCGPMSGFDRAKVDEAFFAGTSVKSNFLCNLGYGDPATLYPRGPRFDFDEVCQIL